MIKNRTAKTWRMYWVPNCYHCRPSPKDKFAVIVCQDDCLKGFLVNSRINAWIAKHPKLCGCQARLEASEHPCLDKDSWVDCLDLYDFPDTELRCDRGPISVQGIDAIRRAVSDSTTIAVRYKKLILAKRQGETGRETQ